MQTEEANKTNGGASLLTLPCEVRDLILRGLVLRQTNPINQFYLEQHELMRPPNICYVNRQLRDEALPLYFTWNTFSLDVTNPIEIIHAKEWLAMIGPGNAQRLRRFVIETYAKVPLGPGINSRFPVRVTIDLKKSVITEYFVMDVELTSDFKARAEQRTRDSTREILAEHKDTPWDAYDIGRLIECFDLTYSGHSARSLFVHGHGPRETSQGQVDADNNPELR